MTTNLCSTCNTELTNSNWSKSWKDVDRKQCKSCSKKYNDSSNKNRMWVNGKYIPQSHPLYKAGRYTNFTDAAFSNFEKYESVKSGYVYVVSNYAWPDWVKIGKAIDVDERLGTFQTGSPFRNYKLIHWVYADDRHQAESKAHISAAKKTKHPWNKPDNGEWFRLTHDEAIEIVENIND